MLQARTIAAIGFVAAAGFAAYWKLSADEPRAVGQDRDPPVPELAKVDIDELELTSPSQGKVLLQQTEGVWRVKQPLDDAADGAAADRAVDTLRGARFEARPAATSRDSWARLNVADTDVVSVTPRSEGEELVTLHVGKDGKYVRIGDGDEVFRAHGLQRGALSSDPAFWRDRSLFAIASDDAARVAVTIGDRTIAAERDGDSWQLLDADFELDPGVPLAIATRFQALKAEGFADDVAKQQAGLLDPRMTISVTTRAGQQHVLLVGDRVGESTYVGKPDADRVWTLSNDSLAYFARPPAQWQDKTIASVEPERIIGIELRKGNAAFVARRAGEGWKVAKPGGAEADQDALDALAGALRNFRGTALAPEVKRIARPTATAVFTTKSGKPVRIVIGEQREDQSWLVGSSTRDDVLVVADYLVAPLLQDRAALTTDGN